VRVEVSADAGHVREISTTGAPSKILAKCFGNVDRRNYAWVALRFKVYHSAVSVVSRPGSLALRTSAHLLILVRNH